MYIIFCPSLMSKSWCQMVFVLCVLLRVEVLKVFDVNHSLILLVILHHDCISHVLSCTCHWSFPYFRSAVLLVDFVAQLCFSLFAARQHPAILHRILLIYNYLRYEIAVSGILQRRFLKGHVWG